MVDLIESIICNGCDKENRKCSKDCTWRCSYYLETTIMVEEGIKKWLSSFDTSSATKCFEAVQLLKERLKDD